MADRTRLVAPPAADWRAREAATRRILDIISRSRDDEGPVFDAILEAASQLCRAPLAFLTVADEARAQVTVPAHRGTTADFARILDAFVEPIDRSELVAVRPVATGEVMRLDDMKDTDLYRAGEPRRLQMVDVEGVRAAVGVPLLKDGVGIGALVLYRREPAPFADEDVALAESFAAQAVIAIENVRQFRELQTRLEREAATRGILEVISTSRDDERPVFDAILASAARLCRAPSANLLMVDERRENLVLCSTLGSKRQANLGEAHPLATEHTPSIAIRTAAPFQIPDIRETRMYRDGDPIRRQLVDEAGLRTSLAVPLLRGDEAVGAIVLLRYGEPSPFSDADVALLETFAAQAVIAIENVRQFREVQQRLAREKASAEILEIISRSRDDERPVFDAILEQAARLCGAPMARLELADDARRTFGCVASWGEEMRSFRVGEIFSLDETQDLPTAIREGELRHIHDLAQTELYRQGDPKRVRMVDEEGYRTYLVVPLIAGGLGIGAIVLCRREVAPFVDADIKLVEAFAAQAVIAIENVRQFRELQARLHRETATSDILSVISRSRDDEGPVFEAIHDSVTRLCDAPFSGLFLLTPDGDSIRIASHKGGDPEFIEKTRQDFPLSGPTSMARAIAETRVVHVEDMALTARYREGEPQVVRGVELEGIRTFLAVPLLREGKAIGAIAVYRRETRPFSHDQISLLETFAAQAVIAIENVRQFKALEALNAELGERVEAQVGEIERMGRLKRFLSPAVAQAITSTGSEAKLSSHRALVAVLFADIRGFTAFCETAEPEETIEVLQTYHEEMGRLLHEHGAGVDHRSGDGIMAIFNDPLPCDDPAGDAVRLAVAMRARMRELCAGWRKLGHRLGFGVGVSLGYATVGMVGSEGRYDYTASGTAVNLGARLCDRAADGEILLSPRAAVAVEDAFATEPVGEIDFKGLREPVEVFRLAAGADAPASAPRPGDGEPSA